MLPTESIITISTPPDSISISAISSACSPVSGWDTNNSSISTPSADAYTGSNACSASINAATHRLFELQQLHVMKCSFTRTFRTIYFNYSTFRYSTYSRARSIDKAPVDIAGTFLHYQFQVSLRNLRRTAFLFGQKLYLVFLPVFIHFYLLFID